MSKFFLFLFSIIVFHFVSICQTVEKTITVDSYKSVEYYEHFKRLTLNTSDPNVEFIDGFQFEWGYTYQLKIRETKLKEDLSDGTQYTHELIEVVNKTLAPGTSTFKLLLDGNRYYHQILPKEMDEARTLDVKDENVFLYFDEIEIVVPSEYLETFRKIVSGQATQRGLFEHEGPHRIRLIKFL